MTKGGKRKGKEERMGEVGKGRENCNLHFSDRDYVPE
jgi:hypothetical protein